ncbi:MAG TPA: response regulator transcription factor, partial [Elusimicrobiota bacterium]|nr:response regulator transcription factor [Elusimicrobiota bacterium]
DPRIIEAIGKTLDLEGSYETRATADPAKALPLAIQYKPDLILLDVRLPGGDGRMVLKTLKENVLTRRIPVIFLTGMSSEGDKVLGLNLGADDYVVKPFGAMELLARMRAVQRRSAPDAPARGVVEAGGLVLDAENRTVSLDGKALRLQPKEFEVLYLLASNPGRSLTRSYLIENSSSYGMPISTRSLDTHIKNLRNKLGAKAALIETLPKLGYRFLAA